MRTLIKKNIRLWGYGKALALFAGCLIFAVSERVNGTVYYQQHLLAAASDHYYLTYFMLPIVLLSCFPFMEDDEETVILRFRSYHTYFFRKWVGAGLVALLLVVLQTVAILLSGIGMPSGNGWNLTAGATAGELFSMLQQFFSTPTQAFIGFTVYQLVGSWLIMGICMWIGHFAHRKRSVGIVVALYIFSAVWMKLPAVQRLPFMGLNHLLILHHNLGTPHRFEITVVYVVLLAFMVSITVRFAWRGKLPSLGLHGRGITSYYLHGLMIRRNLLILCLVVAGLTLYKGFGYGSLASGTEWMYALFAGHGTGYFRVLPFLELLIINGAPLYLLAVFVEHRVNGQSIFISVRTKSRKALMKGILSSSFLLLALYMAMWFAAGFFGAVFLDGGMEMPACKMLLYAVLMKYFDVLLQYLIMLTVYIFTKQITIGFLTLIAGNLLCILPSHWVSYLPFGLSSLTRISLLDSGTGISAATAVGVEAALSIMITTGLVMFGYHKILD